MLHRPSALVIACALALAGCTFDDVTPANAVVTCASNADCAAGQACNAFTFRCVDVAALNKGAPPVATGPTLAPATGNLDTVFTLDVSFAGPVAADPTVRVVVGGVDRFFVVDDAASDRASSEPSFHYTFSPDTSDAEGTWPVDVAWASVAGVPASPVRAGTIALDFTGAVASVQIVPPVAKAGTAVTLTVTTTEPVSTTTPPALHFEGENDPGFVLQSSSGTITVFALDGAATPPDDVYVLRSVDVVDAAGNVRNERVGTADASVSLTVDTRAPTVQQVTANRPVYSGVAGFDDVVVTFSVDERVADDDVAVTFGDTALTCAPRAADNARPQYTCTGAIDPQGTEEGAIAIVAGVVDGAGNVGAATLPVAVDRTPPVVVAGSEGVVLEGAAGAISRPSFASFGTTAHVAFSTNEVLGGDPVVTLVPADTPDGVPPLVAIPLVVTLSAGRVVDAAAAFTDPAVLDDDYAPRARVVDAVGNAADVDVDVAPIVFRRGVPSPCVVPTGNCTDFDGDGQFGASVNCLGFTDCDDSNPIVHLGAVEIPGDGLDNDCGGDGDLPVDETTGAFVDPVNGHDGAAGTRADPLRLVSDAAVVAARVAGSDGFVFMAAGDYDAAGAARMVGGLDPVTWRPTGGVRSTVTANVTTSVAVHLATTGNVSIAQPCSTAGVALVDVAAASVSTVCGALLSEVDTGTLSLFSPASFVLSRVHASSNVFVDSNAHLVIDRSVIGPLGMAGGSEYLITNSVLTNGTTNAGGINPPHVTLVHSGMIVAQQQAFSVSWDIEASWVHVTDFQDPIAGGAFVLHDVAWQVDRAGTAIGNHPATAQGLLDLEASVQCGGGCSNDFLVTDVGVFDGVHLLPTSAVLSRAGDVESISTVIAGDVDGECRGISTDLGPDELP